MRILCFAWMITVSFKKLILHLPTKIVVLKILIAKGYVEFSWKQLKNQSTCILFIFILYFSFVSMRHSHHIVLNLLYNVFCYGYSFLPYKPVRMIAYLVLILLQLVLGWVSWACLGLGKGQEWHSGTEADGRCVGLDAITFQWMVRPCEEQASFFCEKGELRILGIRYLPT